VDLNNTITYIAVSGTQTVFEKIEIPISSLGYKIVSNLATLDALITLGLGGDWIVINDLTLDANKTIPSGVTLHFNGGIISLGGFTIIGNNTSIKESSSQIFDITGSFTGTFEVEKLTPQNFGANVDGVTDDSTYISALLSACNSIKCNAFFPKGSYRISNKVSKSSFDGLNIYGEGWDSKILGYVVNDNVFEFDIFTNCKIDGLHFDTQNTTVGNTWQGNAVYMNNSINCILSNCFGYANTRSIFSIRNSSWFNINNNYLYNSTTVSTGDSSQAFAAIYINDESSYHTIESNRIENFGVGVSLQSVILGSNIKYCKVNDNIIKNSYSYGVLLYRLNAGDLVTDNIVSNNIIDTVDGAIQNLGDGNSLSFGAGIYLQSAYNNTVIGNYIRNTNVSTVTETLAPAAIGQNSFQNNIIGNTIDSANWYGISIFDPLAAGVVGDTTIITGNKISNSTKTSIYIKDASNVLVSDNSIFNSTVQGIRATSTSASHLDGILIDSNIINHCNIIGIALEESDGSIITGNKIGKVESSGTSIALSDCIGTIIKNNVIDGESLTNRGINVSSTNEDTILKENIVSNTTTALLVSSPTIAVDNLLYSNGTNYSGIYAPFSSDDGTATPEGRHRNIIRLTTGTDITYFLNGFEGQELTIYAEATRTITHGTTGTSIRLSGEVDFVMGASDILKLIKNNDGRWDEISRKVS